MPYKLWLLSCAKSVEAYNSAKKFSTATAHMEKLEHVFN